MFVLTDVEGSCVTVGGDGAACPGLSAGGTHSASHGAACVQAGDRPRLFLTPPLRQSNQLPRYPGAPPSWSQSENLREGKGSRGGDRPGPQDIRIRHPSPSSPIFLHIVPRRQERCLRGLSQRFSFSLPAVTAFILHWRHCVLFSIKGLQGKHQPGRTESQTELFPPKWSGATDLNI